MACPTYLIFREHLQLKKIKKKNLNFRTYPLDPLLKFKDESSHGSYCDRRDFCCPQRLPRFEIPLLLTSLTYVVKILNNNVTVETNKKVFIKNNKNGFFKIPFQLN